MGVRCPVGRGPEEGAARCFPMARMTEEVPGVGLAGSWTHRTGRDGTGRDGAGACFSTRTRVLSNEPQEGEPREIVWAPEVHKRRRPVRQGGKNSPRENNSRCDGRIWIYMDMDLFGSGFIWIWIYAPNQPPEWINPPNDERWVPPPPDPPVGIRCRRCRWADRPGPSGAWALLPPGRRETPEPWKGGEWVATHKTWEWGNAVGVQCAGEKQCPDEHASSR